MKKNSVLFYPSLVVSFFLIFLSCKNDDPEPVFAAPVVELTEVGLQNSKIGFVGSDLHIEGTILSEALIQKIEIQIHQEEGGDFSFGKAYTDGKYVNVKNLDFHEHIDIPVDAPLGEYHLHLTVTDQQGQTTTAEAELVLDRKGAKLEGLQVGSKDDRNDGIANAFSKLYIAADIQSEKEISSIKFKAAQQDSENGAELEERDITNSFNKSTGKLSAAVDIPIGAVVGDYLVSLIITDADGNEVNITREIQVKNTPFVEDFEVGSGHGTGERTDRIGYIGKDLHIQGTVYCVINRLKSIKVKIVQDVASNPYTATTLFDESTNYFGAIAGSRNDFFHQHVDLPADMPAGNYKFSFTVEDRTGGVYEKLVNLELRK